MAPAAAPLVTVWTTDSCPYCESAKRLLQARNIPFTEKRIAYDDDAGWTEAAKRSGMKTMPQIYIGETLVGGFRELSALDASGKLRALFDGDPH